MCASEVSPDHSVLFHIPDLVSQGDKVTLPSTGAVNIYNLRRLCSIFNPSSSDQLYLGSFRMDILHLIVPSRLELFCNFAVRYVLIRLLFDSTETSAFRFLTY